MIILCGSATDVLEKGILAENHPLYGRATGIYKMKPMGFYEAALFYPDYSDKDKILAYAVLGGVPHYLNQLDPGLSLGENIKRNILTKGTVLYDELDYLLHQKLRETAIYNAILEAMALGSTTLKDISRNSLLNDTAKTSVYLKNLVDLGIVERDYSIDTGKEVQAHARRRAYHFTDSFFRFWYAYGFPNLSRLEEGDVEGVYQHVIEPTLQAFAALTFEEVCKEFVKA